MSLEEIRDYLANCDVIKSSEVDVITSLKNTKCVACYRKLIIKLRVPGSIVLKSELRIIENKDTSQFFVNIMMDNGTCKLLYATDRFFDVIVFVLGWHKALTPIRNIVSLEQVKEKYYVDDL